MRIMGDLDGCGYLFVPTFADILSEKRNQPRETFGQAESWSFYKQPGWNMTSPEFVAAMEDAIINHDLFLRGGAYPDFEWAIGELAAAGHEIYIVTTRFYGADTYAPAVRQTWQWLENHKVDSLISDVIILDGNTKKSDVCKRVGITLGVDDGPHNYVDLVENGIPCALFDQPWNQDVITDTRVSGWVEFVLTVEKATA